jgi:hypothetical protein
MASGNPNERTRLQAARAYAEAGWPVFPVAAGSKVPAFRGAHPPGSAEAASCRGECGRVGHGLYDATSDARAIERWWREDPARNVGIATGAPGPDVLDIDVKPDGSGFPALNRIKRAGLAVGQQALVRTPSGGIHLYYGGTEQGNGADHANHIDFRSRGGYVVAPPSTTRAGGYVVVHHRLGEVSTVSWREIQEVLDPEALHRQREMAAEGRRRDPQAGDEGRVDRLTNFVAEGEPGDRNFRVFYASKQLALRGQLDTPAIEGLVGAALRAGLRGGEAEARRTIASGQRDAARSGGRPAPEPSRARESVQLSRMHGAVRGTRTSEPTSPALAREPARPAPAPEPSPVAARDDADRGGGDGRRPFVPTAGPAAGREPT